jgi:uncharacterized protein YcfJ
MYRSLLPHWLLVPAFVACGCSSMNNTDKGVLAGGTIGAGTGALIGAASRHPGAGAAIGGLVGALTGGLIGHDMDRTEHRQQEAAAAQAARSLGLTDVIYLSQQRVSDDVIINQIRTTGSTYTLSGR